MKNKKKKYQIGALGGTFDHFHDGHAAFIDAAAKMSERLLIGVTNKKLLYTKSFPLSIQPLKKRFKSVGSYCKSQGYNVQMVELTDIYGPTIDPDEPIDALFVTTETTAGAEKITAVRAQLKLKNVPVHIVDLVTADDGKPIRAERIRGGEINRTGTSYIQILDNTTELNQAQKAAFSKPQGPLVQAPHHRPSTKIVVGDTALETFLSFDWDFSIGVFDGYSKREPYNSSLLAALEIDETITNPAGAITRQTTETLLTALKKESSYIIKVEGEEDLLAVAAVLIAPLGSFVYYGQPDEGLVEVEVTERSKDHFASILNQ